MRPQIELGEVVVTPGAKAVLARHGLGLGGFLFRHACGDWGGIPLPIARQNQSGLDHGKPIMSSYRLHSGRRLWIITEADRSATTVQLSPNAPVIGRRDVRSPSGHDSGLPPSLEAPRPLNVC